ncbi:amidase [Gordonia rubripertincta]|uniref:Amidase n=1 Tax=Gordonia rubripertincta TaxID=36822 RepID=A0AAW4G7Y4_GORRU|nr:amidase [Gordonia rubripertincta]MBM7279279.1 amidase [Gordonia rubripertincta]
MNSPLIEDPTHETDALGAVREALRAIDIRDAEVRALVDVFADDALAEAHHQMSVPADRRGPLTGVPIVVKDIYDVAGHPTGNGSAASPRTPAHSDSEAVRRARAAGAIVLAKATTHEYAWGVTTPPTRNPHDLTRVPGGSSGGTAAAIAAGMAVSGLGTDTGGSIRIPAALCGVAGIKPTFGLVSRRGVSGLSWSLDHTGPLGRSVGDVAALLQAIAGYDPADPYSVPGPPAVYDAEFDRGVAGLRIGLSQNYFGDRLTDDVASAFEATVAALEAAGATIVSVDLSGLAACPDILAGLSPVETVAWHGSQTDIDTTAYGPDVAAALTLGNATSGVDYARALHAKHVLTRDVVGLFDDLDVLVSPTVAMTAPPCGLDRVDLGGTDVPVLEGLNALTIPANVTGIPALSVPCGTDRAGLPVGFQIMGRPWAEATVLGVGATVETLMAHTRPSTTTTV